MVKTFEFRIFFRSRNEFVVVRYMYIERPSTKSFIQKSEEEGTKNVDSYSCCIHSVLDTIFCPVYMFHIPEHTRNATKNNVIPIIYRAVEQFVKSYDLRSIPPVQCPYA